MDKVIIKVKNTVVKEVPLGEEPQAEFMMGRDLKNHIIIEDQKVSRKHVLLSKKDGKYFVKDLGSANGSILNNLPLPPHEEKEVFHGDTLNIGDHEIYFDLPSVGTNALAGSGSVDPFGSTIPSFGSGETIRVSSVSDENNPLSTREQDVQEALNNLKPHLLIAYGDNREVYEINQTLITIGREPSNDIVIPHHSISSRHAQLKFEQGQFLLEDLRSTNGTMVNGTLIHRQNLVSPSLVLFGDVQCLFSTEDLMPSEVQGRLKKQILKSLIQHGYGSKKQINKIFSDQADRSLRAIGETLILQGLVKPEQWINLVTGKGEVEKKKLPLWVSIGIPSLLFLFLVIGALIFLIQNIDKKTKQKLEKAIKVWKEGRSKKDLKLYEEAEKLLQEAQGMANSEKLKEAIKSEYAKMLVDYGSQLVDEEKVNEGVQKWKTVFSIVEENNPAYLEAGKRLCEYFYNKAMEAKNREDKIKFLAQVIESGEDELGFDISAIKKEEIYKKVLMELAKTYFFKGLALFEEDKILVAKNIWTKKLLPILTDQPGSLYFALGQLGSLACEYIRKARVDDPRKDLTYEQFQEKWNKFQAKFPNYLEELRKTKKITQLSFVKKVKEEHEKKE
ncbi:MAG: FHA domain-containing protein [Planctomycetota bacterium]|nr:MAG: FHA domain-containing protein [Planctomycetota bacterium]